MKKYIFFPVFLPFGIGANGTDNINGWHSSVYSFTLFMLKINSIWSVVARQWWNICETKLKLETWIYWTQLRLRNSQFTRKSHVLRAQRLAIWSNINQFISLERNVSIDLKSHSHRNSSRQAFYLRERTFDLFWVACASDRRIVFSEFLWIEYHTKA